MTFINNYHDYASEVWKKIHVPPQGVKTNSIPLFGKRKIHSYAQILSPPPLSAGFKWSLP